MRIFSGSVVNKVAFLGAALLVSALTSGCATVAVFEPEQVAEISLVEQRSALELAAETFQDTAEDAGWARNEDPLSILGKWFGQEDDDANHYWKKIHASQYPVDQIIERVSADAMQAADLMKAVNICAQAMVAPGEGRLIPSRGDVAMFEMVLISGRQARDSFAAAIKQAEIRSSDTYDADVLLFGFDAELDRAGKLADDLAAARMSGALSSLETVSS